MMSRENGAALFVTLSLIVIMFLLATAAMKLAFSQEQRAGNLHDQNLAFNAAELALREGELYIESLAGNDQFDCQRGRCDSRLFNTLVTGWGLPEWKNYAVGAKDSYEGLAAAPAYIIEQLPRTVGEAAGLEGSGVDLASLQWVPQGQIYRITAFGVGVTPHSRSLLQVDYLKQ